MTNIYIYIIFGILLGFALVAIGMSLWDLFFTAVLTNYPPNKQQPPI